MDWKGALFRPLLLSFYLVAIVDATRAASHEEIAAGASELASANASAEALYGILEDFIKTRRWNDILAKDDPVKLGEGSFGVAMKVRLKESCSPGGPSEAVIKLISIANARDMNLPFELIWNELQVQSNVGLHPNLVSLYDYYPKNAKDWLAHGSVIMLMPLAGGGAIEELHGDRDLTAGLKKGGIGEWWDELWDRGKSEQTHKSRNLKIARMAVDLLSGLAHLHQSGYVHRDLKPANIFASSTPCDDTSPSCKYMIADFGLAVSSKAAKSAGAAGTPSYFPPEVTHTSIGSWTQKGDVWAIGLSLLATLTQQDNPTGHFGARALFYDARHVLKDNVAGLPEDLLSLLSKLLSLRPSARPTAADAYKEARQVFKGLADKDPPEIIFESMPKCIGECAQLNCCYNYFCETAKRRCNIGSKLGIVSSGLRKVTGFDRLMGNAALGQMAKCFSGRESIPTSIFTVGDRVTYRSSSGSSISTLVTQVAGDEIMVAVRPGIWLSKAEQASKLKVSFVMEG